MPSLTIGLTSDLRPFLQICSENQQDTERDNGMQDLDLIEGLGEVGDKGVVFFYPGLLEAAPEVVEDGFPDIGDGDVHLRVEVVGEDGFSAAGGAGVPKGGRGEGARGRGRC